MNTATHPTVTTFPADRLAACIGQCADSLTMDSLFNYLDSRRVQLGKDFNLEVVIRDEVNTVLKPLGMGVIVTEHDDGGVLNYSYSLWFPPFKHPAWGDIPSGYRDIPMTYYHRDSNGEVVTEHIGTLVDLCESKAN